ncbi:metal ABC transporter permease [Litoreibacter roseus]|uniref:High-affinity zinc uptake system membrane protein ZnuB n=1 Tax=Litoreibacter roseus TaxID=2601869 RepID=A0A6N6JEC2_9RHOB|nr:metal ABC transporter permease [Litoreibacter roseus]GFE64701.1 membrane protein [Litoreibacter roseus]
MFDDFLVRATVAGIGVALGAAPLGCFVVWRRMAYFGDATAHAAVLGVALSLATSIPVFTGVLVVALSMALLITSLNGRGVAMDTLLGVVAHSSLAFGLVAVSFLNGIRVDLMSYLFGDILAVGHVDLIVIWIGALAALALTLWFWSPLLLSTLNPDLARAAGVNPKRQELILTLALALIVAVAIKIVGVLLIAALLVIPAAAARPLSQTPEVMAVLAAIIAVGSVIGGLQASLLIDTQTGPSIVCCAAIAFFLSHAVRPLLAKRF